ncbi:MAG: sialate O-acetylesterase [Oscillospiraceae bacterium]|nr:sialate O-acetylesterase [Oscillospiraceae bacterium]
MIKLSRLFSDNMILQRNAEIIMRGFSAPNEFATVNFAGKTASAKADDKGFWSVSLGEFAANSEPQSIIITSGGETLEIRNVLIGDIWVCGGQSNMELALNRTCHNFPDELAITNPLIRQFKVPQVYNFDAPADEFSLANCGCGWEHFCPENAQNFTAVGYFFAKKLTEKYGVPVGLLNTAVGGTPVAAWMSREMLEELGLKEELAEAEKCKDKQYIEQTLKDEDANTTDYHSRLWKADPGCQEKWRSADFDDSDWEEIPLCKDVDKGTGTYWYRKTVEIPEELRGQEATIFLGLAVDMDEVFINGEKLGATYYRYPPREYKFTLPQEKSLTIVVRLLCFNGFGGFTAGKNYFIATETRTIDIGGAWKRRHGTEFESPKPMAFFQYKPTGVYNGMISPLFNYAMKGIIWYQGESDAWNYTRYAEKLTAVINGWREAWATVKDEKTAPFIQTQLVYYALTGDTDWDLIREQQKKCLALPCTGLAGGYDLGEYNDLHPQNKRDVGERLARLAMRLAYGEKMPPNVFEMYNC